MPAETIRDIPETILVKRQIAISAPKPNFMRDAIFILLKIVYMY